MADLRQLASLVEASSVQVRAEIVALDDAGSGYHPAAGEWCAKEIVGHLVEADQRGFAGRIDTILGSDRPPLEAWDQAGVAASRADCGRPWSDLLAEFEDVRRAGLRRLETLRPQDLERAGNHPQVGRLTVGDVVHEWPFHDRDHLKQLLENTRAMLWPGLGGAQRFTELHG